MTVRPEFSPAPWLRASLPLLGGTLALLPGTGRREDGAILLLAILGAAAGLVLEARSPRAAWRRAAPGLDLRGLSSLPRSPAGVALLLPVLLEIQVALDALDDAPWGGPRRARSRARARRELRALPRRAAAGVLRWERLEGLDDPRADGPRRRLRQELGAALPLARRLRSAALGTLAAQEEGAGLASIALRERGWSAEVEGEEELRDLLARVEAPSWAVGGGPS